MGFRDEMKAFFTSLALWPLATIAFAWVTYRLLARKAGMKMIYRFVCLHAANVLAKGIIPWQVGNGCRHSAFYDCREKHELIYCSREAFERNRLQHPV